MDECEVDKDEDEGMSTADTELPPPLDDQLDSDTCYHCSGYYGPSNGDPLCGICHDFLYTEDFDISHSQQNWGYGISQTQVEKDDGDSGNDEPSEEVPAISINSRIEIPSPQQEASNQNIRNERDEQNVTRRSSSDRAPFPTLSSRDGTDENSPSGFHVRTSGNSTNSRELDRIARRLALLSLPMHSNELAPAVDLTDRLPPEIWRMVFQKLDPVSLFLASRTCLKWKSIILQMYSNDIWKSIVMEKWPLFNPIYEAIDWYAVFVELFRGLACCSCWIKMVTTSTLPNSVGDDAMAFRSLRSVRLSKELKWLQSDHPDGIEAVPLDHLNYNWLARILGPPQSPYQGGVFYLNIKIPHDYPLKPPLVRFLTKVYHPNISRHGDIGMDCIQHNWTLALFIPQTLLSVQSLLTDPCLEPSMEPLIAYQYVNDIRGFEQKARIWTWKYAMTDVLLN